jgi:hypothetical protein
MMRYDVFEVCGPFRLPLGELVEAADALDAACRVVGDGGVLVAASWRDERFIAKLRYPSGRVLLVESRPATVPAGR